MKSKILDYYIVEFDNTCNNCCLQKYVFYKYLKKELFEENTSVITILFGNSKDLVYNW